MYEQAELREEEEEEGGDVAKEMEREVKFRRLGLRDKGTLT